MSGLRAFLHFTREEERIRILNQNTSCKPQLPLDYFSGLEQIADFCNAYFPEILLPLMK